MSKRERVYAALQGKPVDRAPISFFGHNHSQERPSEVLAPYLVELNRKFGWDFIKVNLRASYYGEAWGCRYRWDPEKGPEIVDHVVKSADDLRKLERLDPTQGVFGDQVKVARLLGEALAGSVPYVQTTFSPLTIAARLTGGIAFTPSETEPTKAFMKEDPEALHQGLLTIAQTLADYARACVRAGADGMFLTSTAWAIRDTLTDEEYQTFGKPYDLMVFEAALQEGATFNIMHICRENVMFDLLADYPVQLFNWDATSPRNPSLKEALQMTDKALWGGINHKTTLVEGPAEAIAAEVRSALEETGGRRLFIGPGCSIPSPVPDANLRAAKEALGG